MNPHPHTAAVEDATWKLVWFHSCFWEESRNPQKISFWILSEYTAAADHSKSFCLHQTVTLWRGVTNFRKWHVKSIAQKYIHTASLGWIFSEKRWIKRLLEGQQLSIYFKESLYLNAGAPACQMSVSCFKKTDIYRETTEKPKCTEKVCWIDSTSITKHLKIHKY